VKNGKLEISKTPNGENPLVHGGSPILGVDVWEHSYYIDYRNARPKYLEAFVASLINWDYVLEEDEKAAACTVRPPAFRISRPRRLAPRPFRSRRASANGSSATWQPARFSTGRPSLVPVSSR